MGNIDITCTGKIRSKDTLVKAVQRLVKQRNLRLGVWEEGMRIVVCPRGYLDFAWTKEKGLFGQWNLRCGCNTTTARTTSRTGILGLCAGSGFSPGWKSR